MTTERATWSYAYEKGLVDTMKELINIPMLRGQNGWTAEGWRSITSKFNEMFPAARFTKQQIQEKEKELKGNYKVIRDARKSGVGWNDAFGMINAEPDQWKKLIADNSKVAKFRKKPFPLYNSCEELYEGSIATGDLNFTSSDLPPRTQRQVEPTLQRNQNQHRVEPTPETSEQQVELPSITQHLPAQRSLSNQSIHQTSRIPFSSSFDGIDCYEVQSAPPNQNLQDQGVGSGRKRKQSQMAAKLGDFIDFRKNQVEETMKQLEDKKRSEDDYSIPRCVDMLDAMEELTDEEKADAIELFESEMKRKIFVSIKNANVRLIWVRKKISQVSSGSQ